MQMGKEVEIWDDSALLNAFDAAISKYKKMHSKKSNATSTSTEKEKSQLIRSTEADVSVLPDQTQESNRPMPSSEQTFIALVNAKDAPI
ncbi:Survival motor neuron, Tudor domain [Dillenia turbinata]|uniref:Survival motor neuron, Tudor domain n=1 Tax=Dillenia turbinata TaxID=194707 RepID=A0AAN8ZHX0_9MAGN